MMVISLWLGQLTMIKICMNLLHRAWAIKPRCHHHRHPRCRRCHHCCGFCHHIENHPPSTLPGMHLTTKLVVVSKNEVSWSLQSHYRRSLIVVIVVIIIIIVIVFIIVLIIVIVVVIIKINPPTLPEMHPTKVGCCVKKEVSLLSMVLVLVVVLIVIIAVIVIIIKITPPLLGRHLTMRLVAT